uniref:Uncharacterized protein n=1 Tax=Eutreptiella gymnastica TaxID=73025 RepID=A0A7S4LE91_9EUGL
MAGVQQLFCLDSAVSDSLDPVVSTHQSPDWLANPLLYHWKPVHRLCCFIASLLKRSLNHHCIPLNTLCCYIPAVRKVMRCCCAVAQNVLCCSTAGCLLSSVAIESAAYVCTA